MITQNTFPFSMPVEWQKPEEVISLSKTHEDWLLNTGSLTERLQALTNSFSVELLGQKEEQLDKSEQRMLNATLDQKWQIREVLLQGSKHIGTSENKAQQNWVFARSVLPDKLCKSQWANLGNQPLGKRIFNDENFVRSEFEIGMLKYNPITNQPFANHQQCWARRSKFTIERYELIVAEAFLPNSPCYW